MIKFTYYFLSAIPIGKQLCWQCTIHANNVFCLQGWTKESFAWYWVPIVWHWQWR